MDKEYAKKKILEKINIFKEHLSQYEAESYKEDRLKMEFIEEFFHALGWDVRNEQGLPEQYKEVIKEDEVKIGSSTKEPDYSFRLFGKKHFFVEVKKPFINIKESSPSALQLRRYGWNAPIPISILTNFKEFAVYDCRIKPNEKDNASVSRISYFTFEDYESKFEQIWNIFSKEAVSKGSFDKYVNEESKRKKGTSTVDESFLEDIEHFRLILAKNIALENKNLDVPQLNFAVQTTIDRILFLRICEDRNIELYGKLNEKVGNSNCYKNFLEYVNYADEKYNSGIFNLKNDKITTGISIEDNILKEIISKLYFPNSQYQFDVIPIEILGKVYEQFLGKIIRLTPSHQAKVETKEEVKKSGGIFYTPRYIVNYIVSHTVGKLIKGKAPKEIEKIRILDPACGSGSFLIGAYTYLLDYHLEYYVKNPTKYKKEIFQYKNGKYYLSSEIKKRILMNNIYGVDLDPQAVELTKLSLLLKVLEHETKDSINQQQKLFQQRVLPNLDDNIKCGNSLVGYDFYAETQTTLSDEKATRRVNVFEWEDEKEGFGKIMKNGKFDLIISNPPYIQIQKLIDIYPEETKFIQKYYSTAQEKNIDIYVPFIEKSISLLKEDGLLGFICPNRFFNSEYGDKLREFLKRYNIYHLVNFRHYFVFQDADAYTCLLFVQKSKQSKSIDYIEMRGLYKTDNDKIETFLHNRKDDGHIVVDEIKPHFLNQEKWYFMSEKEKKIFDKIKSNMIFSDCYEENFQGLITGMDKVFILKMIKDLGNTMKVYSKELEKEVKLESKILFNIIGDSEIDNFGIKMSNEFIIFPYKEGKLLEQKEMEYKYPLTWGYLNNFKSELKKREKDKFSSNKWYQYSRNQAIDKQELSKILVPHVTKKMRSAYDESGKFFIKNVGVNAIQLKSSTQEHPHYFLAILNSPIASFFISKTSIYLSGGFYASNKQFAGNIPIKRVDFSNRQEKELYDKIVNLVSLIREQYVKNVSGLEDRQFNALQSNINKLVYDLYKISKEEQEVIEKS